MPNFEHLLRNVTRGDTWKRIAFMLLFLIAIYISAILMLLLIGAQVLCHLVMGNDNIQLRRVSSELATYITEILRFLSYSSEQRPFPFAPFPQTGGNPGKGGTRQQQQSESAVQVSQGSSPSREYSRNKKNTEAGTLPPEQKDVARSVSLPNEESGKQKPDLKPERNRDSGSKTDLQHSARKTGSSREGFLSVFNQSIDEARATPSSKPKLPSTLITSPSETLKTKQARSNEPDESDS